MVLSNKKLKQKLRAAKAEIIAASEAQHNLTDKDSGNLRDPESKASDPLKILSEAQRAKLSKRQKRRERSEQRSSEINKHREIGGDTEEKTEDGLRSGDVDVKKKKRKRDESEASENVKEKKQEQLNKKKKAKNKGKPRRRLEKGNSRTKCVSRMGVKLVQNNLLQRHVQPLRANLNPITVGLCGNKRVGYAKYDLSFSLIAEWQAVYSDSTSCTVTFLVQKRSGAIFKGIVGGIPYYSTEDDIRSYFEGCGTITNVDCMKFPDTGKFRGIAIMTFKTEAAAKRALALDGSDMGGLFLKIQPFKSTKVNKLPNFSPAVLEGYNRIYIGNLSWDVTEDDLRKLFSGCSITSIRFGEDKETGEFKGYGHVEFADNLSLNMALKLDQSIVCGRPVRISCAIAKKGTITKLKSTSKDNGLDSSKANPASKDQENASGKVDAVGKDQENGSSKVSAVGGDQENNSVVTAVSSKIRRRTCYECGEKGHLSSSCPKKQAAESVNAVAT
ncbi:UNVERIFIED_CONTAM: protein gar2 [Sesamum calycinum]|uniref:Protein gar2 n=1 Tax=Sesamum calycinum TaxID=2727403 RepID=A0AAW2MPW6_9LAMI